MVQSVTSFNGPMVASARGELVGARCEMLGARSGCAQTFIAARGGCGFWRTLGPEVAAAPVVLI